VSSPGEFHPEALSELYMNLSAHTAPTMEWEAVDSLEQYGRSDMIPVLREFAESSPGPDAPKDEIVVRKNAAHAITAIQQREAQQ